MTQFFLTKHLKRNENLTHHIFYLILNQKFLTQIICVPKDFLDTQILFAKKISTKIVLTRTLFLTKRFLSFHNSSSVKSNFIFFKFMHDICVNLAQLSTSLLPYLVSKSDFGFLGKKSEAFRIKNVLDVNVLTFYLLIN